jgi:hypothetical protein
MKLYAGTSGYAYKEWKGSFYPQDLPAKRMLHYYGEHFRTVEINNTFYRMPTVALPSRRNEGAHSGRRADPGGGCGEGEAGAEHRELSAAKAEAVRTGYHQEILPGFVMLCMKRLRVFG